jgi:hypothetical protein
VQGILDFSVKGVLIAGRPFKGIGPIFGKSQRSQRDEYGCGLSYKCMPDLSARKFSRTCFLNGPKTIIPEF